MGRGVGAGGAPSSRAETACCEIIVLVDGLMPRTYYSFRASAINARGAGDPGPPCRRVRTAAPRPPSWGLRHDTANSTTVATPSPGGETAQGLGGRKEIEGAGGGSVDVAGTHDPCPPPRAACSGLGACTVLWEEPFSNGAAIELYEVEIVRIGPEVTGKDVGATSKDKGEEDVQDDDINGNNVHDSHPTEAAAAAAAPAEDTAGLDKDADSRVADRGGRKQQPEDLSILSPSNVPEKKRKEEAIGEAAGAEPPPPPPEVITLPATEHGGQGRAKGGAEREAGGGEVVREVKKRFTRSVPSHMRHLVVRGLATGGDYLFRVAASNVAGMGEAGPWTQIVRVVDPADEDSPD